MTKPAAPAENTPSAPLPAPAVSDAQAPVAAESQPARPDPTRYGDWEIGGRCIDF